VWRRQGKQSFFEKKDQKTFGLAVANSQERPATAEPKVFCFFFSKKTTSFYCCKTAFNLRHPVHHRCSTQQRTERVISMGTTWPARAATLVFPALLLLGGCTATTTVLSSVNPSRVPAADWTDYRSLPVAVRGVVPGRTKPQLAAIFPAYHQAQYASLTDLPVSNEERRTVLFVNPADPLAEDNLCNGASGFRRGAQEGDSAFVVGALCDGPREITRATAFILTKDQSPRDLANNFNTIRDQLYQSLFPGANNPGKYYQGY
jgi:hypothetical protein